MERKSAEMFRSFPRKFSMSRVSCLNQENAQSLDQDLMSVHGFSIDQLMELAGLAVACAVTESFPKSSKKILIVAGPGNNGGDGLVAARHLKHFGYFPEIIYPKPTVKPFFTNLITQCKDLEIPVHSELPGVERLNEEYHVIVDAIFGFSFHGQLRPPFDDIIDRMNKAQVPIVSVDVPSGWEIEDGNVSQKGISNPQVLISLSAPKVCSKFFSGSSHFLGGRFLPPAILKKYNLNLPTYPGSSQCVRLD